ncbi:MAG TPA: hypothetical protein DHW14_06255, partial [Clostridiales bacterium]|nr:hypothetical protein [Clostridiales bacterium]
MNPTRESGPAHPGPRRAPAARPRPARTPAPAARPATDQTLPTIHDVLVRSFAGIVILLTLVFILVATGVLAGRFRATVDNLLDRSLIIAHEEYSRFFRESHAALQVLAGTAPGLEKQAAALDDLFDAWFILDAQGRVAAASGDPARVPTACLQAVRRSTDGWTASTASEAVPYSELAAFQPGLAERAAVELRDGPGSESQVFPWVLVQVAAEPAGGDSGGCLVGLNVLNNDTAVARRYSLQINGSYLSIGLHGVRISANIKSMSQSDFVGIRQPEDLVSTVESGRRYLGEAQLEPGDVHFVASDPIRNSAGRVIGALSVGVPSGGFASLTRDAVLAGGVWLSAALVASMALALIVARRVSSPVAAFSELAQEITRAERVTAEHVERLSRVTPANIRELAHLEHCFARMALTLNETLRTLDAERRELRNLAGKLREANQLLEKKVEERTMELRNAVV